MVLQYVTSYQTVLLLASFSVFCFSQFEGEKREEDIDKQDMIDSRQLQHSMLTGQYLSIYYNILC